MLDPVSDSGVELLEYAQLFLDHSVPARLGVVLLPKSGDAVGLAVCQAFAFTTDQLSPVHAFQWLVKVRGHTQ